MSQNQIDYKKKMQLYEVLGAKEFKKIVMQVEKLKWKTVKKVFPNYLSYFEKKCKKDCEKELKNVTSEERKQEIRSVYRNQILMARKEFNQDKNRNYHLTQQRPTEILNYLEWNKGVHETALLKNIGIAAAALGCIGVGFFDEIAPIVIAIQGVNAAINWQCINLQNYNICRIQIHKKALEEREKRHQAKYAKTYSEVDKMFQSAIDKTKETEMIPSEEAIISQIQSIEQLRQMKEFIKQAKITQHSSVQETETGKGTKK